MSDWDLPRNMSPLEAKRQVREEISRRPGVDDAEIARALDLPVMRVREFRRQVVAERVMGVKEV